MFEFSDRYVRHFGRSGRTDGIDSVSGESNSSKVVFSTSWFDVIAKSVGSDPEPFYHLEMPDYVSVVATTPTGEILLVRQYRPAADKYTIELPSGHVEAGESPEVAARRELLEETGYRAGSIEFLGCLVPDTGRLGNRLWAYAAVDAERVSEVREKGLALVSCTPNELKMHIAESRFDHALHIAVLGLCALRGRPPVSIFQSRNEPEIEI